MDKKYYFQTIQQLLNELDKEFINKVVEFETVLQTLEEQLFYVFDPKDFNLDGLEFYVEKKFIKDLEPPSILVSGEYVSFEHWTKKKDIYESITIFLSSAEKFIFFDDAKWKIFKHNVAQTLIHEIIHVAQSRKRNGNPYSKNNDGCSMTDYLGCPDEIEAYAFNAAVDLVKEMPNIKQWQQLFKQKRWFSAEYKEYQQHFWVYDRSIYNKFLKKVYKFATLLTEQDSTGYWEYGLYKQAS